MKNDKLSLINALHEVKINSWAIKVAKAYNVSEQEVKDLYENNLQTAYDYLNSLNEEGRGKFFDPILGWIFGAGAKKAAKGSDAAPPAAAPTPAEISARAQEKTVKDLADTSPEALAKSQKGVDPKGDALDVRGKGLGFSPQGMKTTDFGADDALKNIKLKKGLTPDEAKAKLDSGARPQDINTRNTARLTIDPTKGRGVRDRLDPDSLRAKYAKGPKEDPTISRPAADLKAGDMRSSLWAKGPPTNAGVAKADAAFKDTSSKIGARRAAEKASSDSSKALGGYSRLNKIAAGLGAAALTGAAAYMYGYNNSGDDAAADAAKTDARNRNDLAMKVAGVERQNPIAKIGVLPQGNLKLGSRGDRVKQLQTELGIKADGIFGKDTAKALRNAQEGLGIQPDAKYGTQTQSAMKRAKAMSDLRGANPQLTKVLPGTSAETPVAQRMYQKNYNRDRMESTEYSSNRLIEGFKSIMSSGSPNLFEAAKKAKKDWDKDGKIESEKDEVWGSRFRAAGIQKEESEAEKAKKNPMSHERDAASSRIPNRELTADEMPKKKGSKVVQTGKNTSTAYKVDEEVEISEARESFTKGTRKIKSYALGDYHAEVRHNPDWQEYQVHFYKNGKHMGEGPVSYHGEDKEDAHDSAKAGLEFLNKRNNMAESVSFSDAELEHLYSIAEANPIAPVPDDYSGAAGGVSIRDLSNETVAEGIRGMRRKDSKFKDDPKRYTNEYPKSYREPGTMSKAEMRDHIEASVRKYLKAGGKIKKN